MHSEELLKKRIDFNQPQEEVAESISDRLTALKEAAGLNTSQLAKKSGLSPLTINLFENPYYEQYDIHSLKKYVEACDGRLDIHIKKK